MTVAVVWNMFSQNTMKTFLRGILFIISVYLDHLLRGQLFLKHFWDNIKKSTHI